MKPAGCGDDHVVSGCDAVWTPQPWRWRRRVSTKRWLLPTSLQGVMSHKKVGLMTHFSSLSTVRKSLSYCSTWRLPNGMLVTQTDGQCGDVIWNSGGRNKYVYFTIAGMYSWVELLSGWLAQSGITILQADRRKWLVWFECTRAVYTLYRY
jgi:hypothetical protein